MNLLLRILLIAVFSCLSQIYLPWWSAIFVALVVELVLGKASKTGTAFYSGFYGISIPWMILATYINYQSESILSVRILELFKLPQFGVVLIVITGLIGGLIGGVGSLTGSWIKTAISREDGR